MFLFVFEVFFKIFICVEVVKYNIEDSVWFVIDIVVYDVFEFLDVYFGGEVVFCQVVGIDVIVVFYNFYRYEVFQKYFDFVIGIIEGEKQFIIIF